MMLTIYGVPFSVHTRKALLAARIKCLDYKLEQVIPFDPPPGWREISPTGLIPALRDGDTTIADSSVICAYLERLRPSPAIYPADSAGYVRALWLEEYGRQLYRHVVHPVFFETVVKPGMLQQPTDQAAVGAVLAGPMPEHLGYLESQAGGGWLAGDALSIADIAILANLVNLAYVGHPVDAGRYPRLAGWFDRARTAPAVRDTLAAERPAVESIGLDTAILP
jgi:glutathione S-transferase